MGKKNTEIKGVQMIEWASIVLMCLFMIIGAYFLCKFPFSWAVIVLGLGVLFLLASGVFIRLKKYNLAKFILILTPSYTLLIVSLITKSNGVFSNGYTYLIPKIFAVIYLMAPIIFFGLQKQRKMIVSFLWLVPSVLLFDTLHIVNGIYIENLVFEHKYYQLFIWVISIIYSFAILSLLIYQKTTLLFRKKILRHEKSVITEKRETEILNHNLRFQANLYSVLNILSKDNKIEIILKEVLTEILDVNKKEIDNRGLIILTNELGINKIGAQIGFDHIRTHNEEQIDNIFSMDDTLFVPIKKEDKVLGYIILFQENNGLLDIDLHQYLNAISSILVRTILLEKKNDDLRRKNKKIIVQEQILRDTLHELQESIDYASLIQESLLPSQKRIDTIFNSSSVLFLPRDKVSGDFHFMYDTENLVYFGVGDCTGHGIPGAFIASMSTEAVRSVIKKNMGQKPDFILNELRESAFDRFEVTDISLTDAMDAGLCMFDKQSNKLYFSGGFINLILIRNHKEITEFKGTKCPIGIYPVKEDFLMHEIDIQKNDTIIITSDGYLDQFGFEVLRNKDSKFMKKRFRSLLLTICHLPASKQVIMLHEHYHAWKGELDQTDDITVQIVKF